MDVHSPAERRVPQWLLPFHDRIFYQGIFIRRYHPGLKTVFGMFEIGIA